MDVSSTDDTTHLEVTFLVVQQVVLTCVPSACLQDTSTADRAFPFHVMSFQVNAHLPILDDERRIERLVNLVDHLKFPCASFRNQFPYQFIIQDNTVLHFVDGEFTFTTVLLFLGITLIPEFGHDDVSLSAYRAFSD